jgi:hypothetical protein
MNQGPRAGAVIYEKKNRGRKSRDTAPLSQLAKLNSLLFRRASLYFEGHPSLNNFF